MIWHSATSQEVLAELKTDQKTGLSSAVASERLEKFGKNLSVNEEEISKKSAFITQLKKPSVIFLLYLLIIYILRELTTLSNDFSLPIVVFLILCVKSAACVISEYKTRNMLSSLRNRIHVSATVLRNGKEETIKGEKLVPGDILLLKEGDYVPADARIIEANGLRCDESVIYNEKGVIIVPKEANVVFEDHTPLKERTNMLYCGCYIITGSCVACIVETGANAEIRRSIIKDKVFTHKGIQDRISDRYNDIMKYFTAASYIACAIIVILGTFASSGKIGWGKFLESLIAGVCFYITIVPGNFATRIGCLLALGIKRFEKDKASIFNPQTLEKLAGVSVICSDKTGTLTQNRMSLSKVYDGEAMIDLGSDVISKKCEVAMRFGALSCDHIINENTDHTELAILYAASRYLNINKQDFDSEFPTISSIPLTPERMIKSTVNMIEGNIFSVVRGAPDIILERCSDENKEDIKKAYEQMCNQGLRVLAISYKMLDSVPNNPTEQQLEYGLEFLGLLGIADRERKGVASEIKMCRDAGISTVMFTGDHINTAASIAEKIGIVNADELSVVGDQIDSLSDEELAAIVGKIKVCARISPEQRIRIVNALHSNNETVLITADSAANHAPMAFADVGCAMGRSGTDVAKENADIIVYDDSFSSIVKAIRNARGVFGNFVRYINYYLSMCTCMFVSLVFNIIFFRALLPTELILLSSIFALLFPILSIGYETADRSIMKQPPRTVGEKPFNLKKLFFAIWTGLGISFVPAIVALINMGSKSGITATFIALVLSLVFYLFSTSSSEMFYKRIFHNRFLTITTAVTFFTAIIIAATPISSLFGLSLCGLKGWLSALLVPLAIPLVFETLKVFGITVDKQ